MRPLNICGCYYTIPSSHQLISPQTEYLPLVSSSFHSTILSNTSRTLLTQEFTNPSRDTPIKECVYRFPLYADVSVVKFTCRIGEKVLYGVVKEKLKAKKVFDEAVAKGETAGLLAQSRKASDVFSTKLGNIPAGESVFVEVTYIGELKNGDGDNIRFTIPTIIAPRYGPGPTTVASALSDFKEGIKIVVDIDIPDGSFIKGVQSPSHPIAVSMGTLSTATELDPTMSKASATLALGSAALEKDFVLVVQTKDSGLPKAILETHSTIPSQRALMATLVPKFTLPPSRPEIVFVADRSGSMDGNMPMLISALKVFLKSMPAGIKFNICSFGSEVRFLWSKSKTYDADTLKEASDHVESFEANLGGTETLAAIQETIKTRWGDIPLEIMLLTDGDIWSQEDMFAYLNEQVNASGGKIRVFPLGIGQGVSHALIEGVARAGNGFAQAVQGGERLDTAVVKMLRGALTPHITNYTLEVKYTKEDDDFEIVDRVTDGMRVLLVNPEPVDKPTISLFDNNAQPEKGELEAGDPKLPNIPSPTLLQAPHKIPSLFAFSRTTVYILMSPETFGRNPTSVVFRATSEHGPLELEIPIEALSQPGDTIHQLAAKKASQDIEEGRGWIYDAKDQHDQLIKDLYPSSFDDLVKKECVSLGERYQVAGKWCSFVAVTANDTAAEPSKKIAGHHGTAEFSGTSGASGNQAGTSSLQNYQMQTMLLGQQKHNTSHMSMTSPLFMGRTIESNNILAATLQDHQMQSTHLNQQNLIHHSMSMGVGKSSPPLFRGWGSHLQTAPQELPPLSSILRKTASDSTDDNEDFSDDSDEADEAEIPRPLRGHSVKSAQVKYKCPGKPKHNPRGRSSKRKGLSSEAVGVRSSQPAKMMRAVTGGFSYRRIVPSKYDGGVDLSSPSDTGSDSLSDSPGLSSKRTSKTDYKTATNEEKIHAIIELQSFNGSWSSNAETDILEILGIETGGRPDSVDGNIWITLVVVYYLEKNMADEEGTWALVVQKAKDWLSAESASPADMQKAREFLGY